jgi:YjgF/chorismate_mutase-like, putative endoribonuclease
LGYRASVPPLWLLTSVREALGTLDRVERVVKVLGMVNCAPGFNQTPAVIDGCSELFHEVFGDAGRHTAPPSAWPSSPSTSRSRSRRSSRSRPGSPEPVVGGYRPPSATRRSRVSSGWSVMTRSIQ